MRALLRALLRVMLRIFFRRIEVTGVERVPRAGPVIFVLNHPNGLIDPAVFLCLAPRRVSFLAKAPLFRMPIIGAIVRAVEAIPVHRRQDAGADLKKNAETFEAAQAILVRGGAEPPVGPVRDLTTRLEQALRDVTLEAEEVDAHALIARAQHVLSATDTMPEKPARLADEFALRRRLLTGYDVARRQWPDRAARLQARLERFEASLSAAGLDAQHLAPRSYGWRSVVTYAVKSVLFLTLGLPAAIVGWLVHYPAYRAVGWVATGIAKGDEDALATVKVLAAALLFPLTWAVVIAAVWLWRGLWPAVLVAPALPLTGYVALHFAERFDRMVGATRALAILLFRRRAFLRLTAERREIREAILQLGRDVEA